MPYKSRKNVNELEVSGKVKLVFGRVRYAALAVAVDDFNSSALEMFLEIWHTWISYSNRVFVCVCFV